MHRSVRGRLFGGPLAATVLAFILLLCWDASGLDLALARLAGTPYGFPWRSNGLLVTVLHEGARALSWVLLAALCIAVPWPVGALRRLHLRERVQLAASALLAVALVSVIKHGSRTSCPWDLQLFGGVARHVSHWAWGLRDGGPGGCFPAGHASAGFAFLGGYFACRRAAPALARRWLAGALLAGLVLGLSQQLRGAHYMSHTLWTAWLCWTSAFALDALVRRIGASPGPAGPRVAELNEA
jgi:membrane-associated PAP2 superfamily phosphatase